MRERVSAPGPMGAAYRVRGDGKQKAAGPDPEDYFGPTGARQEEPREQGYVLFSSLEESGAALRAGLLRPRCTG